MKTSTTSGMSRLVNRVYRIVASPKFFYFIIIFFVFQAVWIALSARYPMAFDEQFHLGIIQLYTHQKGPFFSAQPAGADTLGAVSRDPSYLYHYVMNFPYRLIEHLTHSFTVQIIVMRFINIALLASGIIIFRKVLLRARTSPVVVNTVLLFLVSLPVVPLLGAQINYDNLLIPLTGLAILWTVDVWQALQAKKLPFNLLAGLLVLCLLTSLVKYAFLPIFVAIVVVLMIALVKGRAALLPMIRTALSSTARWQLIMMAVLVLLSAGLFLERYGINTLRYHTPIPECDQVLSVQECQAYSPWARNYEFLQEQPQIAWSSLFGYMGTWVRLTLTESVFTITSRFHPTGNSVDYYSLPPLPVPYTLAWVVFTASLIAVAAYIKRLWRQDVLRIFMIISASYVLVLWLQNFMDYKHLGQPVAIHGRYLLPVLPLIFLLAIQAMNYAWHDLRTKIPVITDVRPILVASLFVIFLIEGGGFVSFIALSRSDWFWPQLHAIQRVNYDARRILNPVVIGD